MDLNDRKIKILNAIISDYIATAEPIGSRTIAKKYDLGISSATVRNEMSDLEEMGFIIQPHASAGRIPSDKGYRLYVDKMLQYREMSDNEIYFLRKAVENNINQIDYLMQETAKAISFLTRYTTIITKPTLKSVKLKYLQLIPVDDTSVALVIVMENRDVRNHIINVKNAPDLPALMEISSLLNQKLTTGDLELKDLSFLLNKDDFYQQIYQTLLELFSAENDMQLYLSGVKNILAFPEFSDIQKAKNIFNTLEEKQVLVTLLSPYDTKDENITVSIGNENDIDEFKNCSTIKAKFKFGDNSIGAIGIIGPTRMDYVEVISILKGLVKNIDIIIRALMGG